MNGILPAEEQEKLMSRNIFGRLGCCDGDRTYIVPVNYAYDGKSIYAHSGEGLKIAIMRSNPRVCFTVDEITSFTHWLSVIAWGTYQELMDARYRMYAIKLFNEKMMHIPLSATAAIPLLSTDGNSFQYPGRVKAVIYRIIISEKTGRFENG
ncbi:pyridoxamine 5'-phosphate oxidase family protein [Foetidibacter luteolus]|uniref:pyridoxamine 5'-phosphate oxidase family protein n=1 Tax=Foetidibacter luteolus TaxID=2608880 RepID=UPI00129B4E68|nr:pyridoxamine 5'-phosphate oxidase family protein [Foetidibacter luteolus]